MAETIVVAGPTALAASPQNELEIATVSTGAELLVLEDRGAYAHVALLGWARQGAEKVLLARAGKRILVALVAPDGLARLQPIGIQKDPDTDITWQNLRIDGWIETNRTRQNLKPIWEEAWTLFSDRCTACHERRVPARYTANQWRSLLKVMGPRTGLPAEKQSLILVFLQYHASDTIDETIAAGTAYPHATWR